MDYICLSVQIIVTQRLDFRLQEDHVYISAKRHKKVICGLILTSFIETIDDAKKNPRSNRRCQYFSLSVHWTIAFLIEKHT